MLAHLAVCFANARLPGLLEPSGGGDRFKPAMDGGAMLTLTTYTTGGVTTVRTITGVLGIVAPSQYSGTTILSALPSTSASTISSLGPVRMLSATASGGASGEQSLDATSASSNAGVDLVTTTLSPGEFIAWYDDKRERSFVHNLHRSIDATLTNWKETRERNKSIRTKEAEAKRVQTSSLTSNAWYVGQVHPSSPKPVNAVRRWRQQREQKLEEARERRMKAERQKIDAFADRQQMRQLDFHPTDRAMVSNDDSVSESSRLLRTANSTTGSGHGDNEDAPITLSTARGFLICLSISLLIFLLTSNVSLMTTIQGSIATELDAATSASWFTSAYLIASTSLIPVAGKLSIIFTPRYYLLVSIVIESTGLLITSQAHSFTVFILGRIITGLGSAAVTPVALILVTNLTSTNRRGLLFGSINMCYTVGVSCGASIAGVLEPALGWRVVFWLQIPVAMFAVLLAFFALPKSMHKEDANLDGDSFLQKLSRLDFLGIIALISSVVLLLYGLAAPKVLALPIILSLVDFLLFLLVEAKWAQDPIMPTSVMSSRANILTGVATIGLMTSRWAVLFYTPVSGIAIRGWSPAISGLLLVPTNIGFGTGALLVGWLHIKRSGSYYTSVLVCFILFTASVLFLSQTVALTASIYAFLTALFLNGFISGSLLNYSLAHLLHLTHPTTHAFVLSLNAMFRGLSGSFGSSIAGGIFLRALNGALTEGFKQGNPNGTADLIRRLLGSPRTVYELDGLDHQIALEGYTIAIRRLFFVGAAMSVIMLLFQAGTGWSSPKSKEEEIEIQVPPSQEVISGDGVVGLNEDIPVPNCRALRNVRNRLPSPS
ncbi:hypothetical protein DV737_g1734, partial [Chaetothyriales sp. CBS 132003]